MITTSVSQRKVKREWAWSAAPVRSRRSGQQRRRRATSVPLDVGGYFSGRNNHFPELCVCVCDVCPSLPMFVASRRYFLKEKQKQRETDGRNSWNDFSIKIKVEPHFWIFFTYAPFFCVFFFGLLGWVPVPFGTRQNKTKKKIKNKRELSTLMEGSHAAKYTPRNMHCTRTQFRPMATILRRLTGLSVFQLTCTVGPNNNNNNKKVTKHKRKYGSWLAGSTHFGARQCQQKTHPLFLPQPLLFFWGGLLKRPILLFSGSCRHYQPICCFFSRWKNARQLPKLSG